MDIQPVTVSHKAFFCFWGQKLKRFGNTDVYQLFGGTQKSKYGIFDDSGIAMMHTLAGIHADILSGIIHPENTSSHVSNSLVNALNFRVGLINTMLN